MKVFQNKKKQSSQAQNNTILKRKQESLWDLIW